ncbi:hypothetical protein ACFL1M_00165 [Patescibacteria group bacterium]
MSEDGAENPIHITHEALVKSEDAIMLGEWQDPLQTTNDYMKALIDMNETGQQIVIIKRSDEDVQTDDELAEELKQLIENGNQENSSRWLEERAKKIDPNINSFTKIYVTLNPKLEEENERRLKLSQKMIELSQQLKK